MARQVLEKHEILNNYAENSLETTRSLFREIDHQILSLNSKELAYKLAQRPIPEGNSHGRVSEYTEMGLIRHQALKEKVRSIPLRSLISRSGRALQALKPCFLMSPLSVAQYIDPKSVKFDLVVIDEASQMRPEDALGAIARSGQIVIVGERRQDGPHKNRTCPDGTPGRSEFWPPTWWAVNGFAAIPTTMLDPPQRAASPMAPALMDPGLRYGAQG